jgi:hypothetical protein
LENLLFKWQTRKYQQGEIGFPCFADKRVGRAENSDPKTLFRMPTKPCEFFFKLIVFYMCAVGTIGKPN